MKDEGILGQIENSAAVAPELERVVQDCQSQTELAHNFEIWYAQKKAKAACVQGLRTATKLDQPDDAGVSYFDTCDQDQDHSNDAGNYTPDLEEGYQFHIYYDFDKEHREPKIKTRKWQLSTPPVLANIGGKRQEKLASRTTARKTCQSKSDLSWGDASAMSVDQMVADDDAESWMNDLNSPPSAHGFETSFVDMTWAEIQLFELYPNFSKYKTYQPSLLRWCCTGTGE